MPVASNYYPATVVSTSPHASAGMVLPWGFPGVAVVCVCENLSTGATAVVVDSPDASGQYIVVDNPFDGNPQFSLTIARDTDLAQDYAQPNSENFNLRALSSQLDETVRAIQEVSAAVLWSQKKGAAGAVISMDPFEHGTAPERADGFLRFDGAGDPTYPEFIGWDDLSGFAALDDGILVKVGPDAAASRSIAVEAGSGLSVENGDGVAGDPTLSTTGFLPELGAVVDPVEIWPDLATAGYGEGYALVRGAGSARSLTWSAVPLLNSEAIARLDAEWHAFVESILPYQPEAGEFSLATWLTGAYEWLALLSEAQERIGSTWLGFEWATVPDPVNAPHVWETDDMTWPQLRSLTENHIADTANPHNITPAQIGTLTEAEITAAIAAGGALGDLLTLMNGVEPPGDGEYFLKGISLQSGGDPAEWASAEAVTAEDIARWAFGFKWWPTHGSTGPKAFCYGDPGAFIGEGAGTNQGRWATPSEFVRAMLGLDGLAIGNESAQSGTWPVALGRSAAALANYATALGAGATSYGVRATAVGQEAAATHLRSTAIGQQAATTAADQIRLGKTGQVVSVPGDATIDGDLTAASVAAQTATWLDVPARRMVERFISPPHPAYSDDFHLHGQYVGSVTEWEANLGVAGANYLMVYLDVRPGEVIDRVRVSSPWGYTDDSWGIRVCSAPPESNGRTIHETVEDIERVTWGAEKIEGVVNSPVTVQSDRIYWLEVYGVAIPHMSSATLALTAAGARIQGRVL